MFVFNLPFVSAALSLHSCSGPERVTAAVACRWLAVIGYGLCFRRLWDNSKRAEILIRITRSRGISANHLFPSLYHDLVLLISSCTGNICHHDGVPVDVAAASSDVPVIHSAVEGSQEMGRPKKFE